jgi:hypothetical protein
VIRYDQGERGPREGLSPDPDMIVVPNTCS